MSAHLVVYVDDQVVWHNWSDTTLQRGDLVRCGGELYEVAQVLHDVTNSIQELTTRVLLKRAPWGVNVDWADR